MKYYIEYRHEGDEDEHHTRMLTPAEIKPKFRELMAKEVIIEAVLDEDGDKLTDPTSSGFDPTRKFRLKYRKENGVKIRYTHWGSMDHTQSHFYKMIGNNWAIFGIEENTAKGAVPEKCAKPTGKGKEQKPKKENNALKKLLKERHAKQRKRNKKRRNQFIILLIMGAVAASLLILFMSATNASNDPHGPGRVANDISSSGEDDDGIDITIFVLPTIGMVVIISILIILPIMKEALD